jgi:predicted enzyme involved in methoxymalonyl-ACP biosynthesis
MSSRILSRRVEQAMLNYIVVRAKSAGISSLIGEYRQTDRNAMVKDHYTRLGLDPIGVEADGSR